MSTKFNLTRDINGYNGFGLKTSEDKWSGLLSATVADSITVPSDEQSWIAIFAFEPGSTVWVSINDTAVVPTSSLASSTSELNPVAREVKAGDVISFITNDVTAQIGVSLYAIQ